MVGYKEALVKINNNFPAYLADSLRIYAVNFSTIFDFIAELGYAELFKIVNSILLDKNWNWGDVSNKSEYDYRKTLAWVRE